MLYNIDSTYFLGLEKMNSSVINILEILNKATTLASVGFSAGYSFNAEKADEYFDELILNANIDSPIFSGIMIIENSGREGIYTVVDGLQRLTTLSLLLSALCESAKNTTKKNEDARFKIFNRYLINDSDVKLQLIGDEHEIYRKIIFSLNLSEKEMQSNLYQTYQQFLSKIRAQKISATSLFKIILKIEFMIVFMESSQFSARELYQSLNANKNDLSQINLISSFISQNCEKSVSLWQRTMAPYQKYGMMNIFKSFMKDYLTIQNNGTLPKENALYNNFKSYFYQISQYRPTHSTIENIYKYSRFYLKILRADFEDFEIKKQFIAINENSGQDAYPYLMEVLDDLENGHIERQILLDILVTINALLANRDENDDSVNFANLSHELNRMIAVKSCTTSEEADNSEDAPDEKKISINELTESSN